MSFPRYPEYKDSGVEWLGEVPAHWQALPLKRACEVFPSNVDKKAYEDEEPVRLCNYTDVYYNERIVGDMAFMEATASAEQVQRFTLRAGDTIVTKDSETADDIAISAFVPNDLPGVVCGYHLSMIRPTPRADGLFVKRLFDSVYAKACFQVAANGLTRVGLSQYALDNVVLPFPPKEEQRTIATFLDHETAKIDALVAEQEKLIALLKEKRQAVISHAVTKGLNPDAPMKDSGIEWLGEVPAHWQCRKLSHLTQEIGDGLHGTPAYVDQSDYFFINGNNLSDGNITITESTRCVSFEDFTAQSINLGNDSVLLSINGTIGNVALYNGEAVMLGKSAAYINCLQILDRKFLAYFLRSNGCRKYFFQSLAGTTIHNLSLEAIRFTKIGLPPFDEQRAIVAFLDRSTAQIDSLISESTSAADLLKERRSALISAAVTGKIDVRGVVAERKAA